MLGQSKEILQDARVSYLLIFDEIIEKKLEHKFLPLDVIDIGGTEPTALLKVSQLNAWIKISEGLPEPNEILIVSLDGEIEWLHLDSVHHIIGH